MIAKYNQDHFVIKMILGRAREGKVSKIITLTDFKMFGVPIKTRFITYVISETQNRNDPLGRYS